MLMSASETGSARSRRAGDRAIPIRPPHPALGPGAPDPDTWPQPDMSVLRLGRRPPPALPLSVFGLAWEPWIVTTAAAASCPPDYVAAPLLASVSALIGHSRWAEATPGWIEPPHLWIAAVGDSGNGKSPGADCLMRDVLPEIERHMLADFPDRLGDWRTTAAARLIGDYFMPMAERVYGDAAASERDRAATTLARWVIRTHHAELHMRHLQPMCGCMGSPEQSRAAAGMLIEADWLREFGHGH